MSRQDANAAFALTSFLYGGNAAYIEDLYARYEADPNSVDAEWQRVLRQPEGRAPTRRKSARGASWKRPNSLHAERDELLSALDGDWAEAEKKHRRQGQGPRRRRTGVELSPADVQQATRDSIRALMLIRAYRIRGHFHANLDPLGLEPRKERRGARSALLRLHRSRLRPQDLPRQGARARIRARMREIVAILRRTYCQTLGVEFMHISDPAQKALDPGAHRGPRQGDHLHPRGQARDPQQAGRGRRLREVLRHQVHRHQALRPRRRRVDDPGAGADHQARRRARREGDRARHGASRPAQRARPGDGQAAPRDLPRVQGRLGDARRRRRLGRREVSPRRLVGPRVRRQQGAPVAHRQPVASRDRRSGGARQGARQAGPARRDAGRPHHGDAAADPRRRGVRRPGRGRGMLRPVGAARATAPAARSTSSSTTRSASPPIRATRAPRPIRPTSPR